ncbi:hypothetical protein Ciccas_014325 [Cichlidogyrus casuarinus]|uniref:G-protein coupled receptors family 1 profile domain-containing protein n=1 Tax=Cichlidogyrus casuarinus TaxID=1844966 RepID=A0ABD2PJH9_9PLAT
MRYNVGLSAFIFVLFWTALISNSMILFTFIKKPKLINTPNMFVLALLLSDLIVNILGHPMDFLSFYNGQWMWGNSGCVFYGFALFTAGHTDILLITATAINRYIMIVKPLKAHLFTKTNVLLGIGACLAASSFWAVLPLLGVNRYVQGTDGMTCSINFTSRRSLDILYSVLILFFAWLFPASVCVFCYTKIFATIKEINAKSRETASDDAAEANRQAEINMAKIALTICVGADKVPTYILLTPAVIAKTAIAINPLIYAYNNKQLRQAMAETIPFCGGSKVKPEGS